MALTGKQRGVLAGIMAAGALTVSGVFGAPWLAPAALIPADTIESRLAFVLRWDLLVAFWLLVSIGMLARHRFFTAEDIDGGGLGGGSARSKILQSVLQNTLEQAVLAVLVHVAWAVIMPIDRMAALPVAALCFALGRLLFWRGYHGGAPGRALGFGLTFYPSALLFALLVVRVVTGV